MRHHGIEHMSQQRDRRKVATPSKGIAVNSAWFMVCTLIVLNSNV